MRGLHIGVKTVGLNERLGVESLIKDDDARLGLLNGEAEEVTEQALVFEAEVLLQIVHEVLVQGVAAGGRRNTGGRVVSKITRVKKSSSMRLESVLEPSSSGWVRTRGARSSVGDEQEPSEGPRRLRRLRQRR